MKKIVSAVLVCVMLLLSLASCASSFDYVGSDLKKYVTLGAYSGITTTAKDVDEITDDDVQEVVDALLDANKTMKQITDRAIVKGDVIYLTYEGHLVNDDGSVNPEKFKGGTTTTATSLTIGAGKMIDGFEDGLIGVVPNETSSDSPFELNVTFPDPYETNTALSGKKAVFYCVVDYIVDSIRESGTITDEDYINMTYTAKYEDGTVYKEATKPYDQDLMDSEDLPEAVLEKIIGSELVGEPLTLDPIEVEITEKDADDNEIKKTVTYVVTINHILGTDYDYPEYNDAFVAEKTDYETVAEYEASVRKDLEEERQDQIFSNKLNAVWQAILDGSTVVKYPTSALKAARTEFKNNLYAMYYYYNFTYYYFYYYYYGSYYWTDFEDFLADYYDEYEDFNDGIEKDVKDSVKEQLVFYSIVKELGYDKNDPITEEEYNTRLVDYASTITEAAEADGKTIEEYIEENYEEYYKAGTKTAEDLMLALYGGESVLRKAMLWDYVMEELTASATVTLE